MTTDFSLTHEFTDIALDCFENNLNHPEINKLLEQKLNFEERKLVKKNIQEDGSTKWVFVVRARANLPQAMQKIIKNSSFSWQEISHFVPQEHCVYWLIEPIDSRANFSIKGQGTWKLSAKNSGFVRVISGSITVPIPFLGKMVEKFIITELKKNYEIEPQIQKEFFNKLRKY